MLTPEQIKAAWIDLDAGAKDHWGTGIRKTNFARAIESLANQENEIKYAKLISSVHYIIGIAERGENRKMREEEIVEKFVLDFVKRLESTVEGQREAITDLEDRLEKAQVALGKIAFMGMDAGMMNPDLEYFYKSQLSNCIGIAASALQSIPATKGGE